VKLLGAATFIYFILSSFLINSAWGALDFSDAAYPEFATSARALALGNAYIAKVDDSAAAFYNPAGLGTVRAPHFHLSNIHFEANKEWINLGTGGSVTDAGSNFIKGFKVDGTRELLQNNPGSFSHSRFHFAPNFTMRHFSTGYLYSNQTRGAFGTQSGAQYEYAKRTDHGPYVAFNFSFLGGLFKVGATGIYLTREEVFGESDINTAINLEDSDIRKGRGILFTTGAKLTLPFRALPTFAVKMNNSTGQHFSASEGYAGEPDQVKQSVDVGFSLTPSIGKTTRFHFELNYKDANNRFRNTKSSRKVGAGLELDFRRLFFLRLGYGDGFGSGGIGVRTRTLEVDLSTYAVDTSNSNFRGNEDRRFVVSISSGL
jgi:hypothetical protein